MTLKNPLIAFHGDPKIKEKYLSRVRAHREADEIIKGIYWENGRGCAVGCTLHSSDHSAYETELGIPEELAHLEDRIFEGLPLADAKDWPGRFLSAAKVGADLSGVWPKFAVWMLTDPEWGVIRHCPEGGAAHAAVARVSEMYAGGLHMPDEWAAARAAAWAAARAAAAETAWAARAARAAAREAWAVRAAARAARAAAEAAAAAWAAWATAWYLAAAHRLETLMRESAH